MNKKPSSTEDSLYKSFRQTETFHPLPVRLNFEGNERCTGFEFEFTGIDLEQSSELVTQNLGGYWTLENGLTSRLKETSLGELRIEQDWRWSQELASWKSPHAPDWVQKVIRSLGSGIGRLVSPLTPWELVTPPVESSRLPQLEKVRAEFERVGALGSQKRLHHAFGTHLNPEIPKSDSLTLLHYLQAFILLHPHLIRLLDIDSTRRWLTFIDPFPQSYSLKILNAEYAPSLEVFIQDYLTANPTRNRGLDLLPLFAYLKPDSLKTLDSKTRSLVKGRPTFHYRLPDCNFSDPHWRVASTWNSWILVELLANSPENLSLWLVNRQTQEAANKEAFLALVHKLIDK